MNEDYNQNIASIALVETRDLGSPWIGRIFREVYASPTLQENERVCYSAEVGMANGLAGEIGISLGKTYASLEEARVGLSILLQEALHDPEIVSGHSQDITISYEPR